MNWTIQDALDDVMVNVRASGLLTSLCTIQVPSGNTGPSGAPDGNYVDVAGLVDIACRMAPLSAARLSAIEARTPSETLATEPKHVLLDANYPTVRDAWLGNGTELGGGRAMIDGQPWTILGTEPDGSGQMTRLLVRFAGV